MLPNAKRSRLAWDDCYSFYEAIKTNNVEHLKIVLQSQQIDPSANDNWAIKKACKDGNTTIVRLLLEDPRVDPSSDGNDAFICACQRGHVNVVKLLLQDPRVNPGDESNEAFKMAASGGFVEIVKILLQDPRVNPASDQNQALCWCVMKASNIETMWLLLDDPRVDGLIAIMKANVLIANVLIDDERWGYTQYPKLYYRYQRDSVTFYRERKVSTELSIVGLHEVGGLCKDVSEIIANYLLKVSLNE